MKQCSRSVPLVETRGVLQCLLACPVCRGSAARHHSLYSEVYPASIYHFSLTQCIMALDAQAEDGRSRRRRSSSGQAPPSHPQLGSLGCGKHRLLVPLRTLIPDVLCEDLQELLAPYPVEEGESGQSPGPASSRLSQSLPKVPNGGRIAMPRQPSVVPKSLNRQFFFTPSSMEIVSSE